MDLPGLREVPRDAMGSAWGPVRVGWCLEMRGKHGGVWEEAAGGAIAARARGCSTSGQPGSDAPDPSASKGWGGERNKPIWIITESTSHFLDIATKGGE